MYLECFNTEIIFEWHNIERLSKANIKDILYNIEPLTATVDAPAKPQESSASVVSRFQTTRGSVADYVHIRYKSTSSLSVDLLLFPLYYICIYPRLDARPLFL